MNREQFYKNGGQTPKESRTHCIKCNEKFVGRDYYQADGFTPIKTIRTCRYCKYLHARQNGFARRTLNDLR